VVGAARPLLGVSDAMTGCSTRKRRSCNLQEPLAIAAALFSLSASARAQVSCGTIAAPRGDTVVVFRPPSDFAVCRDGRVQDDVVAGRDVYFELQPGADGAMFEFRVRGQHVEPGPSGLAAWEERAAGAAAWLDDLAQSSEPIADAPLPAAADAARRPLVAARALYLGVVTPEFHDTARSAAAESAELPVIASTLARWCKRYQGRGVRVADELPGRCASPALADGATAKAVDELRAVLADFHDRRNKARELLVQAEAAPNDAAAQEAAVRALADARVAATAVMDRARALAPLAHQLARAAAVLREAVHATGQLEPGHPVFLARYPHAGNVLLEIEARPVGILAAGAAATKADTSVLAFHFAVVDTHYFDLEVGLGVAGGVPLVPTISTTEGMAVIHGKPVDEFVALALVELEPLRFLWMDKPLAGLLRFPVLGIPLSVDPTNNFFVGAGLGWTGVGSITVGPYLARELSLRPGTMLEQTLPMGTSFASVTQPSVQVGYYVSVSVDLVGLFHLFVPRHLKTFDAVGREL